ncbi:DUF4355 domain-containing protein [Latilactobacillus fragifolii]|uniref:DUF4355 domain-containing protein n=1 Tax=Latilactobacillus fragifolii TaxID=2814244 RepID=UPI001ABAD3AE|nr:DUF4355 domain-containing protein [Latilactobacillus fragifolii]
MPTENNNQAVESQQDNSLNEKDATTQTNETEDQLTFTTQEFDAEVDKRISKALETAKSKWDEQKQSEISQAEKLAKMSAAERKDAEEKAKIAKLEQREKELNMREYRYEAKKELEINSMPAEFVDMVISDDVETTKKNITALKSAFDKSVEKAVTERLKGDAPKESNNGGSNDPFAAVVAKYK